MIILFFLPGKKSTLSGLEGQLIKGWQRGSKRECVKLHLRREATKAATVKMFSFQQI